MFEVKAFENPVFGQVRTTTDEKGEPWFVGKDVATALGYSNTKDALARHVDPEDRGGSRITTPSGEQTMTIINESGLYSLIFSSKLPTAKDFKRWVTSEVLPAIRKTGSYSKRPVVQQRDLTTDDYVRAASIVSNCRNSRLPYVLHFLEVGGFSIPKIEQHEDGRKRESIRTDEEIAIQEAACGFLRKLREQGYTFAKIGQMTDVPRSKVCDYTHGVRKPSPERAQYIIDALKEALVPELFPAVSL